MSNRLRIVGLAALGLLALGVSGCGSDDAASSGNSVDVKITEAGCDPAELTVSAGTTTFNVTNEGADEVTEFEVMDGERRSSARPRTSPPDCPASSRSRSSPASTRRTVQAGPPPSTAR